MKGVIPAAGEGSRLGRLTTDKPKLLLDVDDTPIYKYQLPRLAPYCDSVCIVLGHGFTDETSPNDVFEIPLDWRDSVDFLIVDEWANYENAYTLRQAIDGLDDHVLILCSDVILSAEAFDRVVSTFHERDRETGTNTVGAIEEMQDEMTAFKTDDEGFVDAYGDISGYQDIGVNILHQQHVDTAVELLQNRPEQWFPTIFADLPSRPAFVDRSERCEINTIPHLRKANKRIDTIISQPDDLTWE